MRGLAARAGLAWLVIASVVSAPTARAADRSAETIVEEIDKIKVPSVDPDRVDEESLAKREKVLDRRAKLILELYRADPDHERLAELMPERWEAIRGEGPLGLLALGNELDGVLAKSKSEPLKTEASFQKAFIAVARRRDTAKGVPEPVEDFVRRAPKDARAPRLLRALANSMEGQPEEQIPIYRRIVKDYGQTAVGKLVEGELRRIEALGKPFELEFTDAIKGAKVSVKGLRGKLVVIDFWATWCGPCVAAMPRLKELYTKYHDEGLEILGVSLDEPKEDGGLDRLKAFVAKNEIPWPQYYQGNGWESAFSTSWGITVLPAMFIVAPDGTLASVDAVGQLDELVPAMLKKAAKAD